MVPAMSADETMRKAAGRLLAWYEAMGVDAALEERPLDWLARGGVGSRRAIFVASQCLPPTPLPAAAKRAARRPHPRQAYRVPDRTNRQAGAPVPGARTRRTRGCEPRIDLDGARTLAELAPC